VRRSSKVDVDIVHVFHLTHDLVKRLIMHSANDVRQLAFVANNLSQAQEAW